jgi:hypothetical protein
LVMEIAVNMAEMSSEGRGRRGGARDSPAAGIMGERRPLAPFLHGFMGALPHGDGIHGGGKNVALVDVNSWVEVSPTSYGSSLYIVSRIPVSPSWAAMERAYLGRPDSESGEFYVQIIRREISYNFVIEEFSV